MHWSPQYVTNVQLFSIMTFLFNFKTHRIIPHSEEQNGITVGRELALDLEENKAVCHWRVHAGVYCFPMLSMK